MAASLCRHLSHDDGRAITLSQNGYGYIRMYVCIYVRMYVYIYVRTGIYVYTYIRMYVCIYIYIYLFLCIMAFWLSTECGADTKIQYDQPSPVKK